MATLVELTRYAHANRQVNWAARAAVEWPAAFKRVSENGTVRALVWNSARFLIGADGYGKSHASGQFFDLSANAWAFRLGAGDRASWVQDATYGPASATAGGAVDTDEIYWTTPLPPDFAGNTLILAILDADDIRAIADDTSGAHADSAAAILARPTPDPGVPGAGWPAGTQVIAEDLRVQDRRDVRPDELDDGAIRQERITTAGLSQRQIQLLFDSDSDYNVFRKWARVNAHTWFDWSDPFDGEVRDAFVLGGSGGIQYAARAVNGRRTWTGRCTLVVKDV